MPYKWTPFRDPVHKVFCRYNGQSQIGLDGILKQVAGKDI
jgi:hypothetical protein